VTVVGEDVDEILVRLFLSDSPRPRARTPLGRRYRLQTSQQIHARSTSTCVRTTILRLKDQHLNFNDEWPRGGFY
jgi:hypothetical protein